MKKRFIFPLCVGFCIAIAGCAEDETDDSVVDVDGNTYQTVTIGSQEWFAENLRTSSYANGDPIPHVVDSTEWNNLTTDGYCLYENDPQNEIPNGKLYNWYAIADERNACPTGWHVPTNEEWVEMIDFLGGEDVAGGKLKTTGTIGAGTGIWMEPNTGATNEAGFNAVPAGYRVYDAEAPGYPDFDNKGGGTVWWTSSLNPIDDANGVSVGLSSLFGEIYPENLQNSKGYGASVRCVRD